MHPMLLNSFSAPTSTQHLFYLVVDCLATANSQVYRNFLYLHSQKQLVQWAVYVTAEFYACMLSD